ncbi:hypothetical protein EMIHUDRAFT_212305 [Emiliania huxleyi CCMP1516]|uniref:SS18 N-terminal domain-containing protein n=2 Tax=Emiliania huxleyi TaxID=2903 RepID=A0A0D3IRB4_EMIH1|nr:hypothetical protein EMIHUDRAFT_212305 [Emiliania huxleyi CCMP1516]EOD13799.1 hypothetical protein EMIHUDRAFT_212305 [Emiliania huxleyi CCMP1516]|eukprot:XP_005766228.1 hypothetical protein EMIHUDRAFT_212305 [Emiliania huxleyi CCMP1516]
MHSKRYKNKSSGPGAQAGGLAGGLESRGCGGGRLHTSTQTYYLDENDLLVEAIKQNQNLGRLHECVQYQLQLQQNLVHLAMHADEQPGSGATSRKGSSDAGWRTRNVWACSSSRAHGGCGCAPAPYCVSPAMGQPECSACSRIWCILPLTGLACPGTRV